MRKLITAIISLFLFTNGALMSQWYWQNPSSQGNVINKAVLLNDDHIISVCGGSTIIQSENRGWDWNQHFLAQAGDFMDMDFFNDTTGLAIPESGCIYKTVNAGKSWNPIEPCIQNPCFSIRMIDRIDNEACIVYMGNIYYTEDQGESWTTKNIPDPDWGHVFDFSFVSRDNGWLLKEKVTWYPTYEEYDSRLYRTTDGGSTWEMILSTENNYWLVLRSIQFFSPEEGFLTTTHEIWKTDDGGENWTTIPDPGAVKYLWALDLNHLWIIINNSGEFESYRTCDGGNNWNKISAFGDGVFFNDPDHGVAWSSNRIYYSDNGGMTWEDLSHDNGITEDLEDAFFVNDSTGWVWGNGVIARTSNQGLEWEKIYQGANNIHKIHFFDNDHGYMSLVGGTRFMYESNDGGITWEPVGLPWAYEPGGIGDFWAFSPDTIWVGGRNTHLHCSFDGGSTWINRSLGVGGYLRDIYFLNDSVGWVACDRGVFKTTDAWLSFTEQLPECEYPWKHVGFSDANNGNASNTWQLMYSGNSGNTWDTIADWTQTYDIQHLGNSIAFKTGYHESDWTLMKSYDGGHHWERQDFPINQVSGGLFFLREDLGWVVDQGGQILHNHEVKVHYDFRMSKGLIDFGEIALGSSAVSEIDLSNHSNKAIRIDSIFCTLPFYIQNTEDSTLWENTLEGFIFSYTPPDNLIQLRVRFEPAAEGNYIDSLVIASSLGIHTVILSGSSTDNAGIRDNELYSGIYPNPNNGIFWIDQANISNLMITDMLGKKVGFVIKQHKERTRIEIFQPVNSIYNLSWESEGRHFAGRFIVIPTP